MTVNWNDGGKIWAPLTHHCWMGARVACDSASHTQALDGCASSLIYSRGQFKLCCFSKCVQDTNVSTNYKYCHIKNRPTIEARRTRGGCGCFNTHTFPGERVKHPHFFCSFSTVLHKRLKRSYVVGCVQRLYCLSEQNCALFFMATVCYTSQRS